MLLSPPCLTQETPWLALHQREFVLGPVSFLLPVFIKGLVSVTCSRDKMVAGLQSSRLIINYTPPSLFAFKRAMMKAFNNFGVVKE